jgi:hypothetical protein
MLFLQRENPSGRVVHHPLRMMWYSLSLVAEVFPFLKLKRFRKGKEEGMITFFALLYLSMYHTLMFD